MNLNFFCQNGTKSSNFFWLLCGKKTTSKTAKSKKKSSSISIREKIPWKQYRSNLLAGWMKQAQPWLRILSDLCLDFPTNVLCSLFLGKMSRKKKIIRIISTSCVNLYLGLMKSWKRKTSKCDLFHGLKKCAACFNHIWSICFQEFVDPSMINSCRDKDFEIRQGKSRWANRQYHKQSED